MKKPSYYEVITCEFLETLESLTKTSNFFELAEGHDFPCALNLSSTCMALSHALNNLN